MKTRRYSAGFAAPILWGVEQGYPIAEIAAGLGLEHSTVVAVLVEAGATHPIAISGDGFSMRARDPQPVDHDRTDPAYRAWARSRRAATAALDALEAETQRRRA